ncbi:MAG: creatininase family protein [Clostridiales bacterium]|nr:creatininase family protein [Clostridiales bacterium]
MMKKEEKYKISEMTWMEFREKAGTVHTVILPTGATEAYGPHLPLGTDGKVAEAVALLVAERTGAFVGPLLPVGDSLSLSQFPGTLCVRPESFKEYLRDIMDSLYGWGMKNFLFINGHAGNTPMIAQLGTEYVMKDSSVRVAQIDWWRYVQPYSREILDHTGYMAQGHASECGTSIMKYLFPESVREDKIQRYEPKVVNGKRFPNINRYTPFAEFSDLATIGDGTAASSDKGKAIVMECVDRIVEYMEKDFGGTR